MHKKVLLLVEDNPDDLELAMLALQETGIKTHAVVARDGKEALDYLFGGRTGEAAAPSAVLLDLKLPVIDGFEVLRALRANEATRCLPVIVLSSSKEEADIAQSYRLGANSYIQKSLSFGDFTESVRQVGRYWLDLNEVPESCH